MKKFVLVAVVALLALFSPGLLMSSAFGQIAQGPLYNIQVIPSGPGSEVMAISANGEAIAGSAYRPQSYGVKQAFVWTAAGGIVNLGSLAGPTGNSFAFGVSVNAEHIVRVVGYTYVPGGGIRAFLWTAAGGMQAITPVGNGSHTGNSLALAVNSTGWIGGWVSTTGGAMAGCVYYPNSPLPLLPVGTFGGRESATRGINERGFATGSAQGADGRMYPFIFTEDGKQGILDTDPRTGERFPLSGFATAINNHNDVVGGVVESQSEGSYSRSAPFLYSEQTGQVRYLGSFSGGEAMANAVSDSRVVVGYARVGIGPKHAFVWTANSGVNGLIDLNDRVCNGNQVGIQSLNALGWSQLVECTGVSNGGVIVGNGYRIGGQQYGFVLTPHFPTLLVQDLEAMPVSMSGVTTEEPK